MAAFALLVVAMLGVALTAAAPFPPGVAISERVAIVWLVGYGWISGLLHLVIACTARMPGWAWWLPLLALVALAPGWRRRARSGDRNGAVRCEGMRRFLEVALAVSVSAQLGYVCLTTFALPLEWDGTYVWAIKAKALVSDAQQPGILLRVLQDRTWDFSNQEYPLGLPLLEAWISVWRGGFEEQPLKAIGPIFLAVLVVLLFGYGRRRASVTRGFGPIMLVTAPLLIDLARSGYADVPLAALVGACAIFLLEFVETRNMRWIWLTFVATAGLVATKREGLLLAIAIAIATSAVLLFEWRWRHAGIAAAAILGGVVAGGAPWAIFLRRHHIGRELYLSPTPGNVIENVGRLGELLPLLLRFLADTTRFGLLWMLLAGLLLVRLPRMRQPANATLALFLVLGLAADLLPFLLTRAVFVTQALTALDRLILQLTPIAAILIMRLADWPVHEARLRTGTFGSRAEE